jgi:hypothetical protein
MVWKLCKLAPKIRAKERKLEGRVFLEDMYNPDNKCGGRDYNFT